MSTKKEKLLEEAQRMAMRGQVDKAAAAYRQLLSLEPNAINHRQRLAELLVKGGRLDEARTEFEVIGKHYASNGFYLKAIAVYKQVQKLFPADISLSLTLAGLNQKHGLTANALAEYKQVYDYHEKNGRQAEALKILETMQTVDLQNINIGVKLAEAYFQAGRTDDSYRIFSKVASLLQERGDVASFSKLNSRIQQLFPQKSTFMLEVLEEQIRNGQAGNAVAGLQAMLRVNPNDQRVWDLVVAAYKSMKQPQKLKNAYLQYLKFFPKVASAQAGLITCLAAENDVTGALALLERYEASILTDGAWEQLVECYRLLERNDPINLAILEGLERAYRAGGKSDEVELLTPKISSLKNLAGNRGSSPFDVSETVPLASEGIFFAPPEPLAAVDEAEPFDLFAPQENQNVDSVPQPEPVAGEETAFDEEIEIEIDLDDDFGAVADTAQGVANGDDWLASVGDMFDSIATSPRGVRFDNELETADSQSHYDLGVAFKEMGLFDEAIQEFRQASTDPAMKLRCLVLQGACLREKGDLENSETLLRTLMKPGLALDEACSVKYELALTCSAGGKQDESSALLTDIETLNPGFRDVKSLLDTTHFDESSLDFSDEELQGFDLK